MARGDLGNQDSPGSDEDALSIVLQMFWQKFMIFFPNTCYEMSAKKLIRSSDVSTLNSIFRRTYSLQYVNDISLIIT